MRGCKKWANLLEEVDGRIQFPHSNVDAVVGESHLTTIVMTCPVQMLMKAGTTVSGLALSVCSLLKDVFEIGSVQQGKQKAPTRLTMAAADFVTVFTKSLVSDSHPTSTQKAKENTVDKDEKPLIIPVSLSTTGNNNGRKRITLIDDNDAETSTSGLYTNYVSSSCQLNLTIVQILTFDDFWIVGILCSP